jgi:hypothetical protein
MAFIKLTNTGPHRGNELLINTDWITCVYEDAQQPGGSLSTFIYATAGNKTWVVEESYWEVKKMILAATENKGCGCK